jgi:hypothetical protein
VPIQSLESLLTGAMDYAGLFPPAGLPMRVAIRRLAAFQQSMHAWALSRFIVPIARLDEFERALGEMPDEERPAAHLRVTALGGRNLEAEVRQILSFNQRQDETANPTAHGEALELKVFSAEDIERATDRISEPLDVYFEVPITRDPSDWIAVVARAGGRVKVRTGGLTPEMIPSTSDLVRSLTVCLSEGVPFKATAGLHHPLRSHQALTFEPGGPSAVVHGFINVFLVAAFLHAGALPADLAPALVDEESPRAIDFQADCVRWRTYRVTTQQIAAARRTSALCFGTCVLEEPFAELGALGLL